MKIKKEYIRPVMEVLDTEVGPLMEVASVPKGSGSESGGVVLPGGEMSRQNDFTITDEDSDDDW